MQPHEQEQQDLGLKYSAWEEFGSDFKKPITETRGSTQWGLQLWVIFH